MSKTWNWILGITLVLVILVGVGFTVATFFGHSRMSFGESMSYGHPMMDDHSFNSRAPMDGFRQSRYPMMGHGFLPLMLFGGLLRLFFPLAILAGVGYFAYKKGKKDGLAEISAIMPQVHAPEEG